ncbi:flavin reductase family protein [Candidatus Thioglobus sp.]|nr:flavin reductase family protein [Candidatus Thioglobus sp.]
MQLKTEQIEALDDRYRALFINALSGFKSANMIASCDLKKNTNIAIFTSVFHIGSNPPLLGMISRPHSVSRDTLENILQTQHYTINHVNDSICEKAHQTSARYDKKTSEFKATGLNEEWHDNFPAPFVKESRIQLGMKLREHHQLTANNTIMIIGEITHINIKDDIVHQDGYIDIEKAGSITVSSLDSYHRTDLITQMSYAKPEDPSKQITNRKK